MTECTFLHKCWHITRRQAFLRSLSFYSKECVCYWSDNFLYCTQC